MRDQLSDRKRCQSLNYQTDLKEAITPTTITVIQKENEKVAHAGGLKYHFSVIFTGDDKKLQLLLTHPGEASESSPQLPKVGPLQTRGQLH